VPSTIQIPISNTASCISNTAPAKWNSLGEHLELEGTLHLEGTLVKLALQVGLALALQEGLALALQLQVRLPVGLALLVLRIPYSGQR